MLNLVLVTGRASTTPAKTPSGGDRFIPSRSTMNFDLGHYKVSKDVKTTRLSKQEFITDLRFHFSINLQLQQHNADDTDKTDSMSPSKREMQRLIGENLHGGDINNMRVLSYQNKAPAPPEGYQNPLRVVYSQTKTPASVKASTRYIPQAPDRILDAPEIIDDYCKFIQSLVSIDSVKHNPKFVFFCSRSKPC